MSISSCTDTTIGSQIWRYELDDLEPSDRDRFEMHLMVCEVCRHEVSQMLPAIGAVREHRTDILERLQSEGVTYETLCNEIRASAHRETASISWWSRMVGWLLQWRRSWVLAPAIGAAALVAVLFLNQPHDRYAGLLEFEPLLFERHAARGTEEMNPLDPFSKGMDAYCAGDYVKAIENLNQVVAVDAKNDTAWLYLGVSYYLQKDAHQAVGSLKHVTSSVNPVVRDAACWYVAQAFLLDNQADSTLAWIEQVDRESRWSSKADVLATKLWRLKKNR